MWDLDPPRQFFSTKNFIKLSPIVGLLVHVLSRVDAATWLTITLRVRIFLLWPLLFRACSRSVQSLRTPTS